MTRCTLVWTVAVAAGLGLLEATGRTCSAQRGTVEITVVDRETQLPVPVRMHLRDARGRPVRPARSIYWHDHFVFDGSVSLELLPGQYHFELERGPEFRVRTGQFTIQRGGESQHQFDMARFVNLPDEGWWPGDLHIHRSPDNIELLMRAEELHVGPVITWWNARNLWQDRPAPEQPLIRFDGQRFYHLMAGEDEREGGALMYYDLPGPLPIAAAAREFPSPVTFLEAARREAAVHVDIEKPFWWDVPVWIATGMVDSIGLAHNHMHRSGVLATEAWGKPRDLTRFPGPHGNGNWTLDIYYKLLEAGIRIPPSAGSASGVLANPVGYNRVYVHCGGELSWEAWWAGLRAGRVVVTNGPLLRPLVNGELPGHVFNAPPGESVTLETTAALSLRDQIDYLEIVKNGDVAHRVPLAEYARSGGTLPPLVFRESGWMLVRAITNDPDTFRFASSGPYYVEIGESVRFSRSAAQFFLDWVDERMERVELADATQRDQVLTPHRAARRFWLNRVADATVD